MRKDITSYILSEVKTSTFKTKRGRQQIGSHLSLLTNYWSVTEMQKFVEEMCGLDFASEADRRIFLDFFFSSVWRNSNESFNTCK